MHDRLIMSLQSHEKPDALGGFLKGMVVRKKSSLSLPA